MSSGWSAYYVLGLSALLALGVPLGLRLLSLMIQGKRSVPADVRETRSSGNETSWSAVGQKINTRFFLATHVSLVLMGLGLVLIPGVSAFGALQETRALLLILTLALFAGCALIYSARKGDLDWLKAFRHDAQTKGTDE